MKTWYAPNGEPFPENVLALRRKGSVFRLRYFHYIFFRFRIDSYVDYFAFFTHGFCLSFLSVIIIYQISTKVNNKINYFTSPPGSRTTERMSGLLVAAECLCSVSATTYITGTPFLFRNHHTGSWHVLQLPR